MPAKLNPFPNGIPDTDQCLIWPGMKEKAGYGRWYVGSLKKKAHRVIYCQHHGISLESIEGLVLRHTCDNRPCVNPKHLLLGTQKDNVADMHERNRQGDFGGEKHAMSKLTEIQVLEIFAACKERKMSHRALARMYGVNQRTIWRIAHKKGWKSVLNEEVPDVG